MVPFQTPNHTGSIMSASKFPTPVNIVLRCPSWFEGCENRPDKGLAPYRVNACLFRTPSSSCPAATAVYLGDCAVEAVSVHMVHE